MVVEARSMPAAISMPLLRELPIRIKRVHELRFHL